MSMSQQQANEVIAQKLEQAQKLVDECAEIADDAGVSFYISFGGYGTGASYQPKPKDTDESFQASSCYEEEYGWSASSQSC